ncbi:MAG: HigA family addiction module antitoxin [Candidatus Sumerlaeota bacterium]|nr:HigA family addiction module antitoxin [Candidatus Sumerlaeota bacterium]
MERMELTDTQPVPPGATLAESLERASMTQANLAERTGLSCKTINGIVNEREPITPETAIELEKVFRVPVSFWMNLQQNYDEAVARARERDRLASLCVPVQVL